DGSQARSRSGRAGQRGPGRGRIRAPWRAAVAVCDAGAAETASDRLRPGDLRPDDGKGLAVRLHAAGGAGGHDEGGTVVLAGTPSTPRAVPRPQSESAGRKGRE